MGARFDLGAFGLAGLARGLGSEEVMKHLRPDPNVIDVECKEVKPQAQLPAPDDPTPPDGGMENPTITFSNPSYREWLLHQAAEADTPEERERFLALANGQQVALGDRQTAVLTATKKVGK